MIERLLEMKIRVRICNITDAVSIAVHGTRDPLCDAVPDKHNVLIAEIIGIVRKNLPVHLIDLRCLVL